MTDIVERLRDWPRMTPVACYEAADEIERLRAEVEELRARVKDLEGVLKWGSGL